MQSSLRIVRQTHDASLFLGLYRGKVRWWILVNPAGIGWKESMGIPDIPGINLNLSPIGIR
jgi:hypothetical protein